MLLQGGAAALTVSPLAAFAQESADSYPSRDVRMVCAFPAGSGADVFVRFFTEKMRPFLKGTLLVENRVGASGNLATNYVAKSRPDGYTIFIHAPSAVAGNMHLFKNPGYDAAKAFDVVATVSRLPFTVSVAGDSPFKTLPDLIAHLKTKGEKASYGTTAPTGQVAGAMMKSFLKLPMVEVPYRTAGDSMNDLASGHIDCAMYDPIFAMPLHRAGKIRVVALSSKERMKSAPDIATMHEQGVTGVDVVGWWGALTPKGVPPAIKAKIGDAFAKMASLPETRDFLSQFASDPFIISAEEATKLMIEDIGRWGEYMKVAGLEPKG
jgi:tripartite-type tricarboxylate transporter receptor subunit TctC